MQEQPQGTTSEAESSLPLSHYYYEWLSGHNIRYWINDVLWETTDKPTDYCLSDEMQDSSLIT